MIWKYYSTGCQAEYSIHSDSALRTSLYNLVHCMFADYISIPSLFCRYLNIVRICSVRFEPLKKQFQRMISTVNRSMKREWTLNALKYRKKSSQSSRSFASSTYARYILHPFSWFPALHIHTVHRSSSAQNRISMLDHRPVWVHNRQKCLMYCLLFLWIAFNATVRMHLSIYPCLICLTSIISSLFGSHRLKLFVYLFRLLYRLSDYLHKQQDLLSLFYAPFQSKSVATNWLLAVFRENCSSLDTRYSQIAQHFQIFLEQGLVEIHRIK